MGWTGPAPSQDYTLDGALAALDAKLRAIPSPLLALYAFTLGGATTAVGVRVHSRYFRRFRAGDWVTPDVLARKRWIRGVVTSVGDADNFRFYHTPGFGWRWPLKLRRVPSLTKDLRDQTLHIRIAGVDAPEAAHFGRPAQPFAVESLAWLRARILGRTVHCQLLRRDQYGRIVAHVIVPPRWLSSTRFAGRSLPLDMLRAGWVTTYTQAGAEYGGKGKAEFDRVEAEAKAARRGIWVNGTDFETPAEYKRRYAQSADSAEAAQEEIAKPPPRGWFRRLWSQL